MQRNGRRADKRSAFAGAAKPLPSLPTQPGFYAMTIKQPSDPEDVRNMLAHLAFDCNLGYQESIEERNAMQAAKRWPLLNHLLVENEEDMPIQLPEDRIGGKKL
jgi:hypothetical protein